MATTSEPPAPNPELPKTAETPAVSERRIPAMLVATNGGVMMRITVRTHPMPQRILVDGWPFDLRLRDFLITGKAVYSGYFPKPERNWYL